MKRIVYRFEDDDWRVYRRCRNNSEVRKALATLLGAYDRESVRVQQVDGLFSDAWLERVRQQNREPELFANTGDTQ